MFKVLVIALAAFAAMMFVCNFFPAVGVSTLTVGTTPIRWYWIGMAGTVLAFYKLTSK